MQRRARMRHAVGDKLRLPSCPADTHRRAYACTELRPRSCASHTCKQAVTRRNCAMACVCARGWLRAASVSVHVQATHAAACAPLPHARANYAGLRCRPRPRCTLLQMRPQHTAAPTSARTLVAAWARSPMSRASGLAYLASLVHFTAYLARWAFAMTSHLRKRSMTGCAAHAS